MSITRGFRLPSNIGARLDNLAEKTGRTKTYYATKAITEFLNTQEEILLTLAEVENQSSSTIRPIKHHAAVASIYAAHRILP